MSENTILNAINNTPEIRDALRAKAESQIEYWTSVMQSLDAGSEKPAAESVQKAEKAKPTRKARKIASKDSRFASHGDAIAHVLGLKRFAEGARTGDIQSELERLGHSIDRAVFHNTLQNMKKAGKIVSEEAEGGNLYYLAAEE